jgi:hypothetical protein
MSLLTSILETLRPLLPDSTVAWGVREFFNHHCKHLGHMTHLQIDATNKKASFDLDLKGETQPLHVTIERYELSTIGDKTFIEIKEFHTSREWINSLAGGFIKGRKFEIPEMVKTFL